MTIEELESALSEFPPDYTVAFSENGLAIHNEAGEYQGFIPVPSLEKK